MALRYEIHDHPDQLPGDWDALASQNIFLSKPYLGVLAQSAPCNMQCRYISLWQEHQLAGIALAQFVDVNHLESFGDRDRCLRATARKFIFRQFSSRVLFLGNNMLTGQNAFALSPTASKTAALETLLDAAKALRKQFANDGQRIHLTTFKDFDAQEIPDFQQAGFGNQLCFSTQPNMVFDILSHWHNEQDYVNALLKKYRDQYKRARKKALGLQKRKLSLPDIIRLEDSIYNLYSHVAKNAPFNTFFLAKNHFRVFKEQLQDKFLFYGYFLGETLVGFNTLIKNGKTMDTYFLGYDESVQRDTLLYLNMLYDMIAYSINKGFEKIVFGRTALEIKSSVGAKAVPMYGFMQHSQSLINSNLGWIFQRLEPVTQWQERHPFRDAQEMEAGGTATLS